MSKLSQMVELDVTEFKSESNGQTYHIVADGIVKIHGIIEKEQVIIVAFESKFRGREYYNFREFYKTGEVWKPTQKGFTLTEEIAVEELRDLCQSMLA